MFLWIFLLLLWGGPGWIQNRQVPFTVRYCTTGTLLKGNAQLVEPIGVRCGRHLVDCSFCSVTIDSTLVRNKLFKIAKIIIFISRSVLSPNTFPHSSTWYFLSVNWRSSMMKRPWNRSGNLALDFTPWLFTHLFVCLFQIITILKSKISISRDRRISKLNLFFVFRYWAFGCVKLFLCR